MKSCILTLKQVAPPITFHMEKKISLLTPDGMHLEKVMMIDMSKITV
jgi:hypothetical protein